MMEMLDHRSLATGTYNRCWELLETDGRTHDEDCELMTCAFASRYHWAQVGAEDQFIMSDWMVSRAAGAIGEGALALAYARRAEERARRSGAPDWLAASVAEGMARAHAAAGDAGECTRWLERAQDLVALIADEEDRALIAGQLSGVKRRGLGSSDSVT